MENLPIYAQVIIIALIGIFGAWLFVVLLSVIFANVFGHKIKSESKTINLLISQRYETAKEMVSLLTKSGFEVSKNDLEIIGNLVGIDDYQKLSKDERDPLILEFVHVTHSLMLEVNKNKFKLPTSQYEKVSVDYQEIEDTYRQKSAIYNSDVIGYNYWIRVPLVGFLFKIFRKRKKDLIV